jgi:FAD/FMN-containing dehydrogenase
MELSNCITKMPALIRYTPTLRGFGQAIAQLEELQSAYIEVAAPSDVDNSLQITVDAAARNSQLAKKLIQVNAFLPIGDNPVKSVVSNLLSEQPGYFDRSMGRLRDYVDRLQVITPQGETVSISQEDDNFDSVMDGSFGSVIKTISFSAVPASRGSVRVVRATSVYTKEEFCRRS